MSLAETHATRTEFPQQKIDQLEELKSAFSNVESVILTSVQGLNVAEVSDLRRRLHEAGIEYRVVKNTLAKRAVKGTPLEAVSDDFKEVTAVAWSATDPVGPAKILAGFKKDVDKFIIKSGFQGGSRLDIEGVQALAKMPNMPEMRALLLGTLQALPAKVLGQVNAPASHIIGVIAAKAEKDKQAA